MDFNRDSGNARESPLQSLDLFIPNDISEANPVPVVVFIHGGSWRAADKRKSVNVHSNFCIAIAQRGMITVNVNHRLSPKVQYPSHVNDIALALKWVTNHIQKYSGDPEQIFLAGHSSGGHLGALITLDVKYLRDVNIKQPGFIKT